jgi:hypothetical protein
MVHVGAAVASTLTWVHCGFEPFNKHKAALFGRCFGNPIPFVSDHAITNFVQFQNLKDFFTNIRNITRIFILIKIAGSSFQLELQQGNYLECYKKS